MEIFEQAIERDRGQKRNRRETIQKDEKDDKVVKPHLFQYVHLAQYTVFKLVEEKKKIGEH